MNLNYLSLDNLLYISACLFLASGVGFLCFFSKFDDRKFRLTLLSAHSLMVFLIAGIAWFGKNDAQAGLIWLIPASLDFAVSWLFRISRMLSLFGDSIVVWPALFFLIFGGLQYFLVGIFLDLLWKRFYIKKQ